MLLLQPFFLFLLFTSLISFSLAETLEELLAELGKFQKEEILGDTMKERFRICLENWLTGLKRWNNEEPANVKRANKIAQDLGLTGDDQETSVQLSDPDDKTQPAPWAKGLSLVLFQGVKHLGEGGEKCISLMLRIFVPGSQVFHFTMVNGPLHWIQLRYDDPNALILIKQLVPESDIDLIKDTWVSSDVAYVWHNRDVQQTTEKSQVNDLEKYDMTLEEGIVRIGSNLMYFPWLRNYVKFEKKLLEQLQGKCNERSCFDKNNGNKENRENMNAWIKSELEE